MPSNGPCTPARSRSSIRECTNRTPGGQFLRRACPSISADASTAVTCEPGNASSNAAVEAPVPHPRSSSRNPLPFNPIRFADNRRCSWYPGLAPTSLS